MLEGRDATEKTPAVGKGIGRDIEDTHDLRAGEFEFHVAKSPKEKAG